jgi:hypothetical protein
MGDSDDILDGGDIDGGVLWGVGGKGRVSEFLAFLEGG